MNGSKLRKNNAIRLKSVVVQIKNKNGLCISSINLI